ncbi:MAG: DUF3352 domain-containing protein [Planctomycetota bacterium]|jgi:hypothetical protein
MRTFLRAALAFALFLLTLRASAAAEPLPSASRWIPQDAILVMELSQPRALVDLACDPGVTKAVTSLPAFEQLASQPEYRQFLGVVKYLELTLGTDWQTGAGKLLGGGVTFVVRPQEQFLLIVDAEDPELLNKLHDVVLKFAEGSAANEGQAGRVASAEYRGVTGWTFSKNEAHAIVGNRLLVANHPEVLKTVLDLRDDPEAKTLASLAGYRAAKEAVGAGAVGSVFVNLEFLKQSPPFRQALSGGQDPMAALLFSGAAEALDASSWLALGLHVDGTTLELQTAVDGRVTGTAGPAFALPRQAGDGAMPNLSVPRRIAGFSFYRDLHGFYAAKDDLFPERTSGLIFFENMMGIFFTGRDLTDEVLAEIGPEVRIVVAEQEYDAPTGTPAAQYPAFAAVFRLRNPEQFSIVVEEAWQKALGLINFTMGQQAQPGLIIDRPTHADTKFTMAYFSTAGARDQANDDARFNFRPSLAMVGDYAVLCSAEGLTRDIIDALNREAADAVKPLAGTQTLVEIDVVQLASILAANRKGLVLQNMLGGGKTEEQAETEIGLLLTVLRHLGQATFHVRTDDGQPRATFTLDLNLP